MIAKTSSCSINGIDAFVVDVEADISMGLPVFQIVGLAEASVRESKERVRAAVNNSGYSFPMDRVVVNLAPADVQKTGSGLDLPVAMAILGASGLIPSDAMTPYLLSGELSLDGRIKPVRGILPVALTAREHGFKGLLVPADNAGEAAMVDGLDILPVSLLSQVVEYFSGHGSITPFVRDPLNESRTVPLNTIGDLADVQGQAHAKRALEIAAAGGHHLLMTGPPGSGKSMLAKRLNTILPGLTFEEILEVARIYSVVGGLETWKKESGQRPFRSPHHTISDAGMVGGGSRPMPGEISLAHHGVLFMDELPEFKRNVLEVLRQPLEDGRVTIARAGIKAEFPCQFMLVAAMNPCPCGYLSEPGSTCTCSFSQIQAYRSRISGPLMDRMDIQVTVPRVSFNSLVSRDKSENSASVGARVMKARQIQVSRFESTPIFCNARMGTLDIRHYCRLDSDGQRLLAYASDTLMLSARAVHSIFKVARTIADLDSSADIQVCHVAEAVQYRGFDRENGSKGNG
ncbi:MAG: YifB family Mg chelatase-like AAA ATPase [Desulfotignum sp.]|nr:YifB family Mg chelatase-like AAA ATPase [Desulfotignum sp.]